MRVSRSDRQTAAFVLKWSDLEGLILSISESLPKITINASCSDKLDRKFADVEELKAFRNAERSFITELAIAAHAPDHAQRLGFILNSDDRNNVRLSIDAEEAVAIRLNELCEDFLASVRPWYARVAKSDWSLVLWGLWLAFQIGSVLIALFRAKTIEIHWPKDGIPASVYLQGGLIGLLPLVIGGLVNKLRRKYFPTGAFAFGDGENRHANEEVIRTVLIAGFVVSVVASVALSGFL